VRTFGIGSPIPGSCSFAVEGMVSSVVLRSYDGYLSLIIYVQSILEPLQLLLCLEVQSLGQSASKSQLVSSRNRKEMIGSAVVLCLLFAV
jgi:hypothetical protein